MFTLHLLYVFPVRVSTRTTVIKTINNIDFTTAQYNINI